MVESLLFLIMAPALLLIIFWTMQNDKPEMRNKTKGILSMVEISPETLGNPPEEGQVVNSKRSHRVRMSRRKSRRIP
jgi:hypothetical protein